MEQDHILFSIFELVYRFLKIFWRLISSLLFLETCIGHWSETLTMVNQFHGMNLYLKMLLEREMEEILTEILAFSPDL